jgi:8-amino-7-oxononanoate synthase
LRPNSSRLDYLDFSTNDYLCLSQSSILLDGAKAAAELYGCGATGSRLLSGNIPLCDDFERAVARDKNSESSLIFNSGFQANISVLSSILDSQVLKSQPLVFFDKLNHSSLYQAIFLTKAHLLRYHHNSMDQLSSLLREYQYDPRPKFIVSETVFGMDGDITPLQDIVELAREFRAFLYLDEAHGTGVFGPHGYGLSTTISFEDIPHVIMGTFSKAVGVSGGYIACSNLLKNFMINKVPGFMYSTAPSPLVVGAAYRSWEHIKNLHSQRQKLQDLGMILRLRLMDHGFDTGTSCTHIVPVILKDEHLCIRVTDALLEHGIIVSCVRPPTVSPGSARLRVALNVAHQDMDIEKFVCTLKKVISLCI